MSASSGYELAIPALDVLTRYRVRLLSTSSWGPSGFAVQIVMPDGRTGSIVVTRAPDPDDGIEYLHASIALGSMPRYEDLVMLHRAAFGRNRYAYQVFAPAGEHVNLHDTALHLWGRADGKPCLPEFGKAGTI
jgi:hypothetical protein